MFWISDLDNPQYASLIPQPKKRIINKKRTLGIDNKQHEHLRVVESSGLKPQYGVYPLTPALRLGLVTVLSELGFSPDSAGYIIPDIVQLTQNFSFSRISWAIFL